MYVRTHECMYCIGIFMFYVHMSMCIMRAGMYVRALNSILKAGNCVTLQ